MNDLLRLISKSLKPFGYHVKKYKAPNLLKIANLETKKNASNVKALRQKSGLLTTQKNTTLNEMVVFTRTCIRRDRNIDKRPRITGADTLENTLRCLLSLVKSINHALNQTSARSINLINLDDRSDSEALKKIEHVLSGLKCNFKIEQTTKTGQGASLHQQFLNGRLKNALTYFCEDDYLHEKNAIDVMWNFYQQVKNDHLTHCLIYPQEHNVLYSDYYPSYILKGKDRHWRSIRHATHTFLTHSDIVDKYWDYFENTKYVGIRKKRKKGSEAKTTNRLFKHIPGFSPIKPAAIHLQFEELIPPFYDWEALWDQNKTEI